MAVAQGPALPAGRRHGFAAVGERVRLHGAVQNPGPGGARARVAMATCWKQLTVALRWESHTVAMGTIAFEAV